MRRDNLLSSSELLVELQSRVGSRTQSTLDLRLERSFNIDSDTDSKFSGNVFVKFHRSVYTSASCTETVVNR